jgi:hypothetical protein
MSPLTDPSFLPFKLDPVGRRVLWLRLDAARRRDAAFLDERALAADDAGGWLPLEALDAFAQCDATSADGVFHIGHCGSTLLSRLLEAWPGVQALREPLPLRTVAEVWPTRHGALARLSADELDGALQALWRAWSRPLPPAARTVIKSTSSCNALAAPLLDAQPGMRAVLLDVALRPYLAALLKSPAATLDAAVAAPERLASLIDAGFGDGLRLHALSLPQQCAMGWVAERLRFARLATGALGDRVLRVDFDALLDAPRDVLSRVASHLSLPEDGVDAAVAAPAWGRYAKAQDHGYGRDDRAHDLALSLQRHAPQIDEGERWVAEFLARHPAAAAAVLGDAG